MKFQNPLKELSKFEIALWCSSLIIVAASFILSQSGDILTLIASLTGVTALIFVAKGMVFGQVLTVIFAVFYGIISFFFGYYGEMITYLCMTSPIAVLSVISWLRHPFQDSSGVEVGKLRTKSKILMIISALLVTVLFYFILQYLGNTNLIISTVSITTSYLASFLTLMRSPFYAVAYGANDLILIALWTLASVENISYVPMIICFVMFFINDIYGFVNWQKMKKIQMLQSQNPLN